MSGKSGSPSRGFEQIRRFILPLAILFVLAIVGGYFLTKSSNRLTNASAEPDPLADEREPAPALQLIDQKGKTRSLEEFKGKVVLIGFWAADCSTCVMELPAYNEIAKRYRPDGLEVIAINLDPKEVGEKSAKEIWDRGDYGFGSYLDPEKKVAGALKVETLPSAVVLDRSGRMAFHSYGANDWQSPETARLIEDLLLEE